MVDEQAYRIRLTDDIGSLLENKKSFSLFITMASNFRHLNNSE